MKKIIALLLLLSLTVSVLASCKKKEDDETGDDDDKILDFLNDDLSAYVELDEKYYKGITVIDSLNVLVGHEIIKTLKSYKSKDPVEGDGVISVGDIVHIYYKGFYMKDGEPYYFQGGDNTAAASPHALEIGSGGFIPGFEYNMIGLKPADYSADEHMLIETFFPSSYQAPELAGKVAYFEVRVVKHEEYDAPKLDEAFITETLGISADSLSVYEGETTVDRYVSKVRAEYVKNNSYSVENLVMDAFWSSVDVGARVKKYPEKQVKEIAEAIQVQIEEYYSSSYYQYMYAIDEFISLYLGFGADTNYKDALQTVAKAQVREQLAFYHILNKEGLRPTDEEYAILFDEYLTEALAQNGITRDGFATDEEFEAAKKSYADNIIAQNGENYFRSMIYYSIICDAIVSYAKIESRELKL